MRLLGASLCCWVRGLKCETATAAATVKEVSSLAAVILDLHG